MKKLNVNNPFFDFMESLGDWMILNILFVLSCIPVVTAGTALTALYRVALKLLRGQSGYVVREYVRACKEEWKKSTLAWLFLLLTGGILLFDVMYGGKIWRYLYLAIGCMLLVWSFVFGYTFPLLAQFDFSVKNTLKNALYMSVRHLPYTILIVILNILPVLCIVLGDFTMAMAVPLYCAFGFALTARLNGAMFLKIFRTYTGEAEEQPSIEDRE